MGFWENVESEREYRNITRKDLAERAGFAVSGISLGLSHNSVPSADIAVRIAHVLGVPVEYLVTGKSELADGKRISPAMSHLLSSILALDDYDVETVRTLVQRLAGKCAISRPEQGGGGKKIRNELKPRPRRRAHCPPVRQAETSSA